MRKEKDISKIAVVYARYSSRGQTEQSIEGQLSAARKYAKEKGYTIIHEYCDRAKTGTNDNREAFQKMLKDCAKKQFSIIIVWKVDRFGRNREEITFNKYRAKKHGVHVEYIAENITEGPEGVILESVLEGMAEYYSLQLSQNVKRGMLETAKKHKVVNGHVPLGYKIGPNMEYVIDPEGAEIVRLIFEKYNEGYTYNQIQKLINARGYKNRAGTGISIGAIGVILHNERYTGVYKYKDVIREENVIPQIIDKELFDSVQERARKYRYRTVKNWDYSDYLLTGKLFCGRCGELMVGKSGNSAHSGKYNYYYCTNRLHGKKCLQKPVRQDRLEPELFELINNVVLDDDMIKHIVNITWEYYVKHKESHTEMTRLKGRIKEIDSKISNLIKSVEQGMPYDLIKDRLDELNNEKTDLSNELTEEEFKSGTDLSKDDIAKYIMKVKRLNTKDKSCQKQIISIFVNAIYYTDDKVEIAFNYADDPDNKKWTRSKNTFEVRTCPEEQGQTKHIRTYVNENVFVVEIYM